MSFKIQGAPTFPNNSTGVQYFGGAPDEMPIGYNVPTSTAGVQPNGSWMRPAGLALAGAGVLGDLIQGFSQPDMPTIDTHRFDAIRNRTANRFAYGMGEQEMNRYMQDVSRRLRGVRNTGQMVSEIGARTGLSGFGEQFAQPINAGINDAITGSYMNLVGQNENIKQSAFNQLNEIDRQIAQIENQNRMIEAQNNAQASRGFNNLFNTLFSAGTSLVSLL